MGDAESALSPSKKRVADRQITQLYPEPDNDSLDLEMGTFERANEEVLATRRIVKVRRQQPPSAASSNPFAGICLVPPADSSAKPTSTTVQPQDFGDKEGSEEHYVTNEKHEKTRLEKQTESEALVNEPNGADERSILEDATNASATMVDDKVKSDAGEGVSQSVETDKEAENGGKETEQEAREEFIEVRGEKDEKEAGETEKEAGEGTDKSVGEKLDEGNQVNDLNGTAKPAAPVSSFQQLSSNQNAFTGLTGTGFSTSSFSFGSFAKEGSAFGASSGSLFGSSNPSFGMSSSNNENSSLPLYSTAATDTTKNGRASSIPSIQEVPIETGEENEKVLFNADAALYEYLDGGWKERGKGELKVNINISGADKARLVMRARGNYRLILNASLYPDMHLTNMEKKGITFVCVNSAGEGKSGLTTFALKFRDSTVVEEFRGVLTAHKGKKANVMKTPDNSPKASGD